MANSSGSEGRGVKQEVSGVVLLALGLYSAVSLLSGVSGSKLGGVVGEYVSGALFYSFGYSSYMIPFFLTLTALKLLLRRVLKINITAPLSLGALIFAVSALMGIVSSGGSAGGRVGSFIGAPLSGFTGPTVAVIILLAVVLAALLAITGIAPGAKAGK